MDNTSETLNCDWMFTGTLKIITGHFQWWVDKALDIWELLSGRLGVPLYKENVKYLRHKVLAGMQCPFYEESPVQVHPQAPDTMLCLWVLVIVLLHTGLLAYLDVFPC